MNDLEIKKEIPEKKSGIIHQPFSRRKFLVFTGITAAAMAVGTQACKDDPVTPSANAIDVGTGDIGVLNYAYALEQLEAAFYIKVATSFYTGATAQEIAILTDIRDHEIAHREFFKAALASNAIAALEVDFSAIDFTSRASVLNTAKAFEDLGVSAYNGAGHIITSVDYLGLAGKIVSVEARHAAAIRDLLNPRSIDFADDVIVNAAGLDVSNTPVYVVSVANGYLKTKISANHLA